MPVAQVISTLRADGTDIMGPQTLLWRHPEPRVINGALLTVESNHFGILKSRGAILSVYEMGQHAVQTPERALTGTVSAGFFGGQNLWQYEVMYVNRAKLLTKASGTALSVDMAELFYDVDFYFHVALREDAIVLATSMPIQGEAILVSEIKDYAGPVIEHAINQVVQVTQFDQVNAKIYEITEHLKGKLVQFLRPLGITLGLVKVTLRPREQRMRDLTELKAFGLSALDAVRYYTALEMAKRGIVSAPNVAVGQPFNIGNAAVLPAGNILSAAPESKGVTV